MAKTSSAEACLTPHDLKVEADLTVQDPTMEVEWEIHVPTTAHTPTMDTSMNRTNLMTVLPQPVTPARGQFSAIPCHPVEALVPLEAHVLKAPLLLSKVHAPAISHCPTAIVVVNHVQAGPRITIARVTTEVEGAVKEGGERLFRIWEL